MGTATPQIKPIVEGGYATVAEACRFLGISKPTLMALVENKCLAVAWFGPKSRRIPWNSLKCYASKNTSDLIDLA